MSAVAVVGATLVVARLEVVQAPQATGTETTRSAE